MIRRATQLRLGTSVLCLAVLCFAVNRIARGWGSDGHHYVAALAVNDLPAGALKDLYQTNLGWFETNSSFPDRWLGRRDQAAEARHFFHPEAFTAMGLAGKVPHDYSAALKYQSYEQLREAGVLPWTIDRHYKLLVNAWIAGEWDAVLFESALLSHYVADAHGPFHATANSDGQLSDPAQPGIHDRYEIQLVEQSIRLPDLKSGPPIAVRSPAEMSFNALQDSAALVPAILDADRRGAAASGGQVNGVYWGTFIPLVKPLAISRLQSAGQILAGLLSSAWKDAGSPKPPPDFLMSDRFLPYAPPPSSRGEHQPTGMPHVTDDAKDDARENVKSIKIASAILKRDIDVSLILPTDYDSTKRRYPVLYMLHGSSGSEKDWPSHSGIAAYVREIPLIVIMPDGGNSWYVNSPGQGNYEDFFTNELIPAIDKQLRTIPQAAARAIAGNSMGGYGAWRLAIDHPNLFAATASLSGAMDMGISDPHDGEPIEWCTTLYGSTDSAAVRRYNRNSLHPRISRLNFRGRWHGPALYFDAGSDDYLLAGDRHMEQFLLEQGIPYEYAEFEPGDHSWQYWDLHIRDALQFILRHLAAPTGQ